MTSSYFHKCGDEGLFFHNLQWGEWLCWHQWGRRGGGWWGGTRTPHGSPSHARSIVVGAACLRLPPCMRSPLPLPLLNTPSCSSSHSPLELITCPLQRTPPSPTKWIQLLSSCPSPLANVDQTPCSASTIYTHTHMFWKFYQPGYYEFHNGRISLWFCRKDLHQPTLDFHVQTSYVQNWLWEEWETTHVFSSSYLLWSHEGAWLFIGLWSKSI